MSVLAWGEKTFASPLGSAPLSWGGGSLTKTSKVRLPATLVLIVVSSGFVLRAPRSSFRPCVAPGCVLVEARVAICAELSARGPGPRRARRRGRHGKINDMSDETISGRIE